VFEQEKTEMSLAWLKVYARLAGIALLAAALKPTVSAQDSSSGASASPTSEVATPQANPPQAPQPQTSSQQPVSMRDYAKPKSHFPNLIAPYTPTHIAPAIFSNTGRIDQLLQNGKLYLSMDDAVTLALENNMDIAIARYTLSIADTDILRAKAGGSILGVNSGVVQNTPGGGVGGLGTLVGSGTGGTSAGSGGAGAGLGGIVGSTLGDGPTINSYDPVVSSTIQSDHLETLATNAFSGAPPGSNVINQNTNTYNFAYNQAFQWGTNMSVGFTNTRTTTNDSFTTLSPQLNSGFQFKLTQHLLQGFGFAPNTRFIQIAKNDRAISDAAFRQQIITTVDQIENIYWDLVYAYENVRVIQESVAFADRTLSDTKKQVDIGTLAPIQVVQAQATVASNQQQLTIAKTNLELQQLLMKNALSRTLVDPRLADAEVVPTSTMLLSTEQAAVPTEELIKDALAHRAELAQAHINLTNQEISNKAIRSSLLPTLDAFAYYNGSGLGGSQNPTNLCVNQNTIQQSFGCAGTGVGQIPVASAVGYGSTLNQLVNSTAPDKGVGVTLNIPLRNRFAQATQIRSELEYRQAQVRLQQIENQIRIEVRNAQFAVQQNLASVESAQAAVAYARQSLDAEQKKLALGASTSTLVLQNESALATSESTLVSATAAYEKSRIELDRSTGLLLDNTGIHIADAETGQVNSPVHVPDVTPRKEPPSATPTQQPVAPQQ